MRCEGVRRRQHRTDHRGLGRRGYARLYQTHGPQLQAEWWEKSAAAADAGRSATYQTPFRRRAAPVVRLAEVDRRSLRNDQVGFTLRIRIVVDDVVARVTVAATPGT